MMLTNENGDYIQKRKPSDVVNHIRCSCGRVIAAGSGETYYRFGQERETVCSRCLADFLTHLAGNHRLTA